MEYKIRRSLTNNSFIERRRAIFLVGVVCLLVFFMTTFASAITWDNTGYYNLNETVGVIAIDSSNNINGTNTDVEIGVAGKIGTAYLFNQSIGYVNITGVIGESASAFTISAWIYSPSFTASSAFFGKALSGDGANELTIGTGADNTTITTYIHSSAAGTGWGETRSILEGNIWHHIVVIFDGSGDNNESRLKIYVNGINESLTFTGSIPTVTTEYEYNEIIGQIHTTGGQFNGTVDEFGIWNRSLSEAEVLELYNSGAGITYGGTAGGAVSVTLDSPSNNTALSDTGTNFSTYGNVTSSFNATNITYYIWDASDDSIFNQSTVVLDGNASFFNESLFIDNFTLGNYIWNVKACWENSTYSNCSFATNNFTFNVVPASVLSESYSSVVLEGDASLFTINMSIITTDRLTSATLVYNGTSYSASATEYATNTWFLSYTHNIPEIDATENVTFYWNIKLESGFGYNSTSHNQTIVQIAIDDCSSYTFQMFNFTLVDEKDQTLINGATENTSIKIDMSLSYADGSGEIIQFFQNYTKVNPGRVCMETAIGNSTLRMDAVIEYSSAARFVEFYNIQNFTFTNATGNQTILLYNLKESEGQEFKITYKGQDFIPVTNLIIQIQRKYIEEGVFKTIEIPMSGSSGYTIAHLVPNDVVYNLAFIKNGVVLDLFTEVIANCQNPTITECEINLNALITGDNLISLVTESDFWSSLTFNKTSRVVRATYGIVSGVSSVVQLNVSLVDNFGNQTVCSDSLNAAGGTLSCTVPASFGNSTIYATITYDGDVRREGYISLKQSPKDQYAGVIIFASIILLLFIFGIGISDNPTITGIFLILGSMLLVGLNLVYTSSWVGAGASILWFIIAVLIVIIKGGSKR